MFLIILLMECAQLAGPAARCDCRSKAAAGERRSGVCQVTRPDDPGNWSIDKLPGGQLFLCSTQFGGTRLCIVNLAEVTMRTRDYYLGTPSIGNRHSEWLMWSAIDKPVIGAR